MGTNMENDKKRGRKSRKDYCEMTAGEAMVEGLRDLHDSLKAGERLEERYTMRTIELDLEPQEYTAEDIKKTRERLKASQSVFAILLGTSVKTVQSWEQGSAIPPMARRLLDEINNDPERWITILRQAAGEKQKSKSRKVENRQAIPDTQ